MELGGSLPLSQENSTGPYPEPDQSSPYHYATSRKVGGLIPDEVIGFFN
jgi:hypothetical protein